MERNVYDVLEERGFLKQCSHPDELRELLGREKVTFYIGFDPTADSLHIGHYVALMTMAHMQRAGHRPIVLLGGGTAMIGDPSGKTDMRRMMSNEEIDHNAACFQKQMARLIDFSDGKALVFNNAEWIRGLNFLDFMREIGVHFSVNTMLRAECYRQRMERGLTFFEMSYMLMQSYDFLVLNRRTGCVLQMGGDDQWSNILGGADLIRRKEHKPAYALTTALLTTSEGKKMGKTERGAVWLDPEKTPPYEFFQYWRNIGDGDVIKCMKMLTFMPLDEIAEYEKLEGSAINSAKEKLAYELTKLVHGDDEANKALEAARAVFAGAGRSEDMPTTTLTDADFENGSIAVTSMLTVSGLAPSKSEAKRLIKDGGITVGDSKVTAFDATVERSAFEDGLVLKKGKKTYHRFILG